MRGRVKMATVITQNRKIEEASEQGFATGAAFTRLRSLLPRGLCEKIRAALSALSEPCFVEEIRLRSGRRVCLTLGTRSGKRNLPLEVCFSQSELSCMLERLCDGSLYAYGESICRGYISLGDGIRVGVCGHASLEDAKIRGVYDVSSLNLRIPHRPIPLDPALVLKIKQTVARGEGVLVYSRPANGKTTLLRSLCYALSCPDGALRVVAVDSRDELCPSLEGSELSLDVLCGYPKAEGIHIATAYMNPDVIICDEIGAEDDVGAIISTQNCGVPLIASTHGEELCSTLRRPAIARLHEIGAFGLYVGVAIRFGEGFDYLLHTRKEAGGLLEASRNISLAR